MSKVEMKAGDMAKKFLEVQSRDNFVFYVPLTAASEASPRIIEMLNIPGGDETVDNCVIRLPYSSHIVSKVCQYIMFKAAICRADAKGNIPEFNVSAEDAVFLLDVAIFLDL